VQQNKKRQIDARATEQEETKRRACNRTRRDKKTRVQQNKKRQIDARATEQEETNRRACNRTRRDKKTRVRARAPLELLDGQVERLVHLLARVPRLRVEEQQDARLRTHAHDTEATTHTQRHARQAWSRAQAGGG
jgi:hypothetical protein